MTKLSLSHLINPLPARKFKNNLLEKIKKIPSMPNMHRKSIFFDRKDIKDMIFKGYIIVYKIDEEKKEIIVFGFSKYDDNPF